MPDVDSNENQTFERTPDKVSSFYVYSIINERHFTESLIINKLKNEFFSEYIIMWNKIY